MGIRVSLYEIPCQPYDLWKYRKVNYLFIFKHGYCLLETLMYVWDRSQIKNKYLWPEI